LETTLGEERIPYNRNFAEVRKRLDAKSKTSRKT
jgi:hypothetical protein